MSDGRSDVLAESLRRRLEGRLEVLEAYLFGSAARDELAAHSDVDVAVLNEADPVLYHRVLRDGVRLVSRDLRATTTREGYALSRYCDWVPQLAKIAAAHRARIERGEFGR